MGMSVVRQLAIGFSLVDEYHTGTCEGFDFSSFWSESLLMAVACQELGGVARIGAPDELFSCGLLSQIGRLALATIYPGDYAEILKQAAQGAALLDLERAHLEVDHHMVTAVILTDCAIPKALSEPLLQHDALEKANFAEGSRPHQLAHLFLLARRITDLGLASEVERHGKISELMRLGGKIGLDADAFGMLFDRIVERWQAWGTLLKIPATALPAFESMTHAPLPRPEQEACASCKRVLLVEDEPTSRIMTERTLRQLLPGCSVHTAQHGKDALPLALEVMPQIVITDWLMPVMDGLEFCRALRATDWGQSMYVIMLTGIETEDKISEAFEAGVDDYIIKPVNLRAMNARMRAAMHYVKLLEAWEHDRAQLKQFAGELAISNRRLEHAAMTDQLTGLANRRAGMDVLANAWSAALRSDRPLAALVIDIDLFKSINDQHGHAMGDLVLQEVAKSLQAAARKHDTVIRMGGEEFLVICHDADQTAAILAAERLRKLIKALRMNIEGTEVQTSVSIGVACRETDMAEAEQMIRGADKALYAAKHAGRNKVCLYSQGRTIVPEFRGASQ
jgi:diguanylate cyclase (GGDEF)-like protein